MKRLASLMAVVLAVAATPAFSQSESSAVPLNNFASSSMVIPTMANVAGQQGARFQSHVSIMNPTTNAFPVRVSFYDAAGTKTTATIQLAAGELKVYENFMDSVLKLTGAGAARFETDDSAGGQRNNRFILSSEVWTTSAAGRFGTTVPAFEFAGSDSKSFAAGITVDPSARTNVGCFNQSASANNIKVTIYDGTGKSVATLTLSLLANAWGQTGVGANVVGGYAVFEPSESAVCWASVVDNSSNDGRFVSAAEYAP